MPAANACRHDVDDRSRGFQEILDATSTTKMGSAPPISNAPIPIKYTLISFYRKLA